MVDEESISWIQEVIESTRLNQTTSFLFGVVLVIFLWMLGIGINRTTDVVDLSSPFITVVRAASLGLGTGYYFGAALKRGSESQQWIFFGAFTTLTIGGVFTIQTQLFEWIPASILLIAGGFLSILAHLTPAIQTTEDYKKAFRFLSGILTTTIVILLGVLEYLITLADGFVTWLFSMTSSFIVGSTAVIIALVAGFLIGAVLMLPEE